MFLSITERYFYFKKPKKRNKFSDRTFHVVRGVCCCGKCFYILFDKKIKIYKDFHICPYCSCKVEKSLCWYGGKVRGRNKEYLIKLYTAIKAFTNDIPDNLKVRI
jgi:hypothetical protein